jgi:hypothetical protein
VRDAGRRTGSSPRPRSTGSRRARPPCGFRRVDRSREPEAQMDRSGRSRADRDLAPDVADTSRREDPAAACAGSRRRQ